MSNSQTIIRSPDTTFDWSALFQLLFSALAALLLLGLSFLITVASIFQFFSKETGYIDLTQSFMLAASLAFAGFLVLPSAWYAWKKFSSQKSERPMRLEPRGFVIILTLLVLTIVPLALWLGNWASQNDRLSWFLLPILNIIATGLPAFWIVYLGIRGLNPGSPRRVWGTFASGLILSPAIILILELIALVAFGILIIIGVSLDPGITSQMQNLVFQFQNADSDPDAIVRILLPFLLRPGILFASLTFISLIVPIIEETLKPIGVWFNASQKLTPAQGFAYGVLCGAGFGLFENLGNTSGGGETWAILVATRISTLLLHCLNTGLVGWALASAWSQKRYLRLGFTFAFAILLHGLWNGMAVLSSISSLEGMTNIEISADMLQIGNLASIGIVAMSVFNLVLYISFNSALRNQSTLKQSSPDSESPNPDVSDSTQIEEPGSDTVSSISANLQEITDSSELP